MTATERGIFWTMRLECWANGSLPSNVNELAVILGLSPGDVAEAISAVKSFFVIGDTEIRCPELDEYREYLDQKHTRLSDGGKASAASKSQAKSKPNGARKPPFN